MKWFLHKSLSENDMARLTGTHLMEALVKNRIVIKMEGSNKIPSSEQIGLYNCKNVYYYQELSNNVIEILFQDPADLEMIKEQLTSYKLGLE